MNNKKGFTLAELLIVVAIIAVLTAIAIPIFNTQLEHSREETDIANMRAGQAAAVAYYMDHPNNADNTVFFDAQDGNVTSTSTGIRAYGRGTTTNGRSDAYPNYDNQTEYVGSMVQYTRVRDTSGIETINVTWVTAPVQN